MNNSRILASGLSLLKVKTESASCKYLMFQIYKRNNYVASNPYSSTMIALLILIQTHQHKNQILILLETTIHFKNINKWNNAEKNRAQEHTISS